MLNDSRRQVAPFYAGRTELGEAVCRLARMRMERHILEAAMETPSSQIMLRIHRNTSRPPGSLVRPLLCPQVTSAHEAGESQMTKRTLFQPLALTLTPEPAHVQVELFLALHMVLDTPKDGTGQRVASYHAWVAQQDLAAADKRRGVWERCRRDMVMEVSPTQPDQRTLMRLMREFDHPDGPTRSSYRARDALAAAAALLADKGVDMEDAESGGLVTVIIFRWLELVRDQFDLRVRVQVCSQFSTSVLKEKRRDSALRLYADAGIDVTCLLLALINP
jgi:hypothetical protein